MRNMLSSEDMVCKQILLWCTRQQNTGMAIDALKCSEMPNSSDSISRQAAIDLASYSIELCNKALDSIVLGAKDRYAIEVERNSLLKLKDDLKLLPSAQPDMAENLCLYKCYITDKDGLQHEVIHTGDIRRVTGWEI